MFPLNRLMRLGAIGLLAAAAPVAAARAATPTAPAVGQAAPAPVTQPLDSFFSPIGQGGDFACFPFKYSLGPFGPLGPWGPAGPLHNRDHPACIGGGPAFK